MAPTTTPSYDATALADALDALASSNRAQNTITVVFGVLPIVLAFFGLLIAYLQLRRARVIVDIGPLLRTSLGRTPSVKSSTHDSCQLTADQNSESLSICLAT